MNRFIFWVVFLSVIGLLLQIDDDLETEAIALLDRADPAESNDAFLYLLGLHASAEQDPLEFGKAFFSSYQQYLNKRITYEELTRAQQYGETERLPLPDTKWLCRVTDTNCLTHLGEAAINAPDAMERYKTILSRYQTFLTFTEFDSMTAPDIDEVTPSYQYLLAGNRLVFLHAHWLAQSGRVDEAFTLLKNNLDALRRFLGQQDTLIGKMVFLMQVASNIDVLALLAQEYERELPFEIPFMTMTEKSFSDPIAHEFAIFYALSVSLEGHPQIFSITEPLPDFLSKMVFKPNMTSNAVVDQYTRLSGYAQFSPAEFERALRNDPLPAIKKNYIRNPVGSILSGIAMSHFSDHIGRMIDLDIKINLVNTLMRSGLDSAAVAQVPSPYASSFGEQFVSENGRYQCVAGPVTDERFMRCLRIAR